MRVSKRHRAVLSSLAAGRVLRVLTAALGSLLLVLGVASTVASARESARAGLDQELAHRATAQVSLLSEYFERARTIDLLLAQNSVFAQEAVEAMSGGRAGRGQQASGPALAFLESLYPGRISEACLIASDGRELSRVTRGVIAAPGDLSADESDNPFFAPTLALGAGEVYQSSPYVSPDTDQWVIANSTPVVDSAGRQVGQLHFEVLLDSFLPRAASSASGSRVQTMIVDARTQRIVLDRSGVMSPTSRSGAVPAALRPHLGAGSPAGTTTIGGSRVAYAKVPVGSDNANSWYVVISAPSAVLGSWTSGVHLSSVLIVLAALLLFAFAATNLRSTHRRLQEASLTDELTGLPNRRLLGDRLNQAMLQSERRHIACAVLLIDLDRFKEVNDTLGHHHGDHLLRAVADRLRGAVRESDTVARLGGDEFAVVLPEVTDEVAALELANRCLESLHAPFTIEGIALNVEASVGVALAPMHGRTANALLRAADVAMYEAKDRHGGVHVYEPGNDVHTPHRLALLGDLRQALQNDQLVMHYQPKIGLRGSVLSVEALVRWHHPTRGLVPPDDFIPVAEGTGLMMPLTLRTLEMSVAQARTWLSAGRAIQVAVNLSPSCLLSTHFPEQVREILERHGLPVHLLRLEVTESTVMADPPLVLEVLSGLRAVGIALSIDDFGTGYSSMSYLKRLPVDELKIDRMFVSDMLSGGNDDVLVRSSIDLAHNLGLSVVAEGVEDQATVDALAFLGCDVVQGFHLGRPMPADEFDAWLAEEPSEDASVMAGTSDGS